MTAISYNYISEALISGKISFAVKSQKEDKPLIPIKPHISPLKIGQITLWRFQFNFQTHWNDTKTTLVHSYHGTDCYKSNTT